MLIAQGRGRGTRSLSIYLSVRLWNGKWFREVSTAPLWLEEGKATDWEYVYEVKKLPFGGIEIEMRGKATSGGDPLANDKSTKDDPPFLLPGITLRFETTEPAGGK